MHFQGDFQNDDVTINELQDNNSNFHSSDNESDKSQDNNSSDNESEQSQDNDQYNNSSDDEFDNLQDNNLNDYEIQNHDLFLDDLLKSDFLYNGN